MTRSLLPVRLPALLFAAGALLATACGADENTGTRVASATSGSAPARSTPAGPKTFKPGDLIKVGDLVMSVTGVQAPFKSANEFVKPEKGEFLVVSLAIENHGPKPDTVSSMLSFELRDEGGQSYNETLIPDAPKPPDGEIAPGDRLAGALSYDVPAGHDFRLYFKNDVFAGGQVIIELGRH